MPLGYKSLSVVYPIGTPTWTKPAWYAHYWLSLLNLLLLRQWPEEGLLPLGQRSDNWLNLEIYPLFKPFMTVETSSSSWFSLVEKSNITLRGTIRSIVAFRRRP